MPATRTDAATEVRRAAEPFDDLETVDLGPLLDRIGEARVVCLGESTHGTCEFYRLRARITRELIARRGFSLVAVEADWPDAARIDRHVRHLRHEPAEWSAFARFPRWMWRNAEVSAFVDWLHAWNAERDASARAGFFGLDLYSLYTSIDAVLEHLEREDPRAAAEARARYGCLTPFAPNPVAYGRMAASGRTADCEDDVVSVLGEIFARRARGLSRDPDRWLDATRNARLVENAERYYRTLYRGAVASWNLRDSHMFETLEALLDWNGPGARAVVWAHNSHLGDARATEMGARGEHNLGHLCRVAFGNEAFLVGFGTDRGTVAAASAWGAPMEVKTVRPALPGSYEAVCRAAEVPRFLLPLRAPRDGALREVLSEPRLERAIGVLYLPETERRSHYFEAVLPRQFDEWIWFGETTAVRPLDAEVTDPNPDTWPFGL